MYEYSSARDGKFLRKGEGAIRLYFHSGVRDSGSHVQTWKCACGCYFAAKGGGGICLHSLVFDVRYSRLVIFTLGWLSVDGTVRAPNIH